MPGVVVSGLSKSYLGKQILKNVSFSVKAGEVFACRIEPGITLAAISTGGDSKLQLQIYDA